MALKLCWVVNKSTIFFGLIGLFLSSLLPLILRTPPTAKITPFSLPFTSFPLLLLFAYTKYKQKNVLDTLSERGPFQYFFLLWCSLFVVLFFRTLQNKLPTLGKEKIRALWEYTHITEEKFVEMHGGVIQSPPTRLEVPLLTVVRERKECVFV